jgi:hypothetical protein
MARNKYAGYCYVCGDYVPVGGGYAERRYAKFFGKQWQLRCIKCVGKGTPEHLKGGSK